MLKLTPHPTPRSNSCNQSSLNAMGHKTKPKNTKGRGGGEGGTRQDDNTQTTTKICDSRRKTYLEEIQCGGWVMEVSYCVCMPVCARMCVHVCVCVRARFRILTKQLELSILHTVRPLVWALGEMANCVSCRHGPHNSTCQSVCGEHNLRQQY